MSSSLMHTFALRAALDHARQTGEWIVVVTPAPVPGASESVAESVLRTLAVHRGADCEMGGRTLLLPEGGRVTVAHGEQMVAGDGFRVMFVGFDGSVRPSDEIALHTWRQAAKGTLGLGERPGEVTLS